VWIAIAQANADGHGVEHMLAQLEALVQFTRALDGRLTADGMEGIAGMLALHRRLQRALEGVPEAEIARMQETVHALERALAAFAATLSELARLKAALGA
jgi:hypothetical protein